MKKPTANMKRFCQGLKDLMTEHEVCISASCDYVRKQEYKEIDDGLDESVELNLSFREDNAKGGNIVVFSERNPNITNIEFVLNEFNIKEIIPDGFKLRKQSK